MAYSILDHHEERFLYNINHASFVVFDVNHKKLRHKKIYEFMYKDIGNMIYVRRQETTGILRLCHKRNGYISALSENSVEFRPEFENPDRSLSVIYLSETEIAIRSNERHACAELNGAFTFASPWIRGWEKFAVLTRSAALDLVEKRVLYPFPPRKNRRIVKITSREKYGERGILLDNVRVTATDWSLLCSNGALLTPNSVHLQRGHHQDVIIHQKPEGLKLSRACLIGGYYNYYHHLADYMINIFSVQNWIGKDLPLLTIKMEHAFQKEMSAAFDLDSQIIKMDQFSCGRIESLLVPEKAIIKNGVIRNRATIRKCVDYLQRKYGRPGRKNRRIFISREVARSRRATNEDQAILIAKDYGFEKVILEGMSFVEQVRLFSEAEAVIGLHGAGFTNLIFAQRNCFAVEFMPSSDWRPDFFVNLAAGLGHRFERISAKGSFQSTNIEIDLKALRTVLQQI